MEIKEWVPVVSVGVVVVGWIINGVLNKRHEIFKKRLDFRLKMLDSYILAAIALERLVQCRAGVDKIEDLTQDFLGKLEDAQVKIFFYGSSGEISAINEIVGFAEKNDHNNIKIKSNEFMNIIRINLRKELRMKAIV